MNQLGVLRSPIRHSELRTAEHLCLSLTKPPVSSVRTGRLQPWGRPRDAATTQHSHSPHPPVANPSVLTPQLSNARWSISSLTCLAKDRRLSIHSHSDVDQELLRPALGLRNSVLQRQKGFCWHILSPVIIGMLFQPPGFRFCGCPLFIGHVRKAT